jgi:hypothetical protein
MSVSVSALNCLSGKNIGVYKYEVYNTKIVQYALKRINLKVLGVDVRYNTIKSNESVKL